MQKITKFQLGHSGFCQHTLKVLEVDRHFVSVEWGEDREESIKIKKESQKLTQHSFTAYDSFNSKEEIDFNFATNLFQASVDNCPMLCLQVVVGRKDKFLWIPKTKSNLIRIKQLIAEFDGIAYTAYEMEGKDFNLSMIVSIATDRLPHFEELKFLEMPEELDGFETEPNLENDVEESLGGDLSIRHNVVSKNKPKPFVLCPNTDLTIPQSLYYPDGTKKPDWLIEEEAYQRLNLEAERMEASGLLDRICNDEYVSDEERTAVKKGVFVRVKNLENL